METSVTALWNVAESQFFNDKEKFLIQQKLRNRINSEGILQVTSTEFRTQLQNKNQATERILEMVNQTLIVPKKRIKTKPSKSKIEKRLNEKKQQSEKKENRKFRL